MEGKAALDFVAVQCFQCSTYQVQRGGKKSATFGCKVCGAKQSVQVVFARSPKAPDVRRAVQTLNEGRADAAARADAAHLARAAAYEDGGEDEQAEAPQAAPRADGGSRWAEFLDTAEDDAPAAEAEGDALEADTRFVTSLEAARTVKRNASSVDEPAPPPPKRSAPQPQPPPAAFQAPPAGVQEAPAQRWGRPPAPAPLSPRRANANRTPPAAPAAGGKWAAFAGAAEEEDW